MSDETFIKNVLKLHAYQNIPLSYEDAYELGCYALKGCHGDTDAQIQSIVALSALHTKATYAYRPGRDGTLPQNAAEQIAGICAAIFEHDIGASEFGFLKPNVPYVMDNCGMGGDLIVTANVSTIAAFIAAAYGIHMCKHGSPANADKGHYGSSDFIEVCGISTVKTREEVEASVEQTCFGYTEALDQHYKRIHMQTHNVAKVPHMNDIIGPITNPVDPKLMTRRVLGVNHLIPVEIVAEVYRILNERGITNMEHAIMMRGFGDVYQGAEGMDELSICKGGTDIAELLPSGEIKKRHIEASAFGLTPVPSASISPPSDVKKGDFSLQILEGKVNGPALQMVLANASLLLYLAGHSNNLRDCYEQAKEIHTSGLATKKLREVRLMLPR